MPGRVHLANRLTITGPSGDEELQRTFTEAVEAQQAGRRATGHEGVIAEVEQADPEELPPRLGMARESETVGPDAFEQAGRHTPTDRRFGQAQLQRLVDTDDAELAAGTLRSSIRDAHTRMCACRHPDRKSPL